MELRASGKDLTALFLRSEDRDFIRLTLLVYKFTEFNNITMIMELFSFYKQLRERWGYQGRVMETWTDQLSVLWIALAMGQIRNYPRKSHFVSALRQDSRMELCFKNSFH